MKRLGSSYCIDALISMCPASDEQNPRNNIYNSEYQSMLLEGFVDEEETGHMPEKKRRLTVEQVKALERNFEVENKLEPERKVKLAKQIGLQPRQVAVWFQNRRARWKTKQLERDYGVLKATFDSLKHNFESLQHDNDSLLNEIKELKSKLNEDKNSETNNMCIKKESLLLESKDTTTKPLEPITPPDSLSHDSEGTKLLKVKKIIFSKVKDGQSDSDSSAILNEDNSSPNASNSSTTCSMFPNYQQDFFMSPNRNSSPPSIDCFGFCDLRSDGLDSSENNIDNVYNPQFVKIEERNFFSGEDGCNFFSEEQDPSLHWYCSDQWT